ncbi:MAG: hypothetical protein ABIH28_00100 [archaeon]
MKRAKFQSLEKQREFFVLTKKKLGLGAKALSKLLGLKSRGAIESYTFMRTAPPVALVKKLEKMSGINGTYQEVEGKIYWKKRGFIPLDSKEARKNLGKKFGEKFQEIDLLIKTNLSIVEILNTIRKKGYTFDNSKISRDIGAYRTNLLSEVVENIVPKKNEIILKGHIRKDKHTLSINFNLMPLYNLLKKNKILIKLELSNDRKRIRISPSNFGRKLIPMNRAIKILLTEKSGLKIKSNVEIILNPKKFGFSAIESIYDFDAKVLLKKALEEGFTLDPQRSTPNNHKGDLSLYLKEKSIVIEITKAESYKNSYFKIGQCFIQKISWPKSKQYLICKNNFLSKESENALKKLGVKIIKTNFDYGWEREAIQNIKNGI